MISDPAPVAPPRLTMRGIGKRFGATVALDGVDLSVAAGSVHALVGENGAGKSTLVKMLSGAHRPDAGAMVLDGATYRPSGPLAARRAGVVMVYQELALAPHLSVAENILLGMEPTRIGFTQRRTMRETARRALTELEHPEIPIDVPVGTLAVGARQIVEIARAVALGCRVLVLDEPTSSLNQEDVQRLFRLIRRLRESGIAIVYISHFLEEVLEVADRFTVLRDGRTVGGGRTADVTADDIVRLMVGRGMDELYPRSARTRGDVVLEIEDLCGNRKPIGASLTLHRGEVLGIAGLVGSGRTELLRAVFGLEPVRRGEIRVGAWVGPASPAARWTHGVGFLSEDRGAEGLALGLSLADNVTLSRLGGLGPAGLVLPHRQDAATRHWIDALSVRCQGPRQPAGDLSGGNQQKLAVARLLHHDVDVLLLDEPTRGIDVASKVGIYRLIDELAAGTGGRRPRAILMVSSYLPELLGVCDRIAVMYRGRLEPARPVEALDEYQLMLAATGTTGQESAA
jgi:ribose transport system ATP-binding protein